MSNLDVFGVQAARDALNDRIIGQTADDVYPRLLGRLLDHGHSVAPRGLPTLELHPTPTVVTILDPRRGVVRHPARRLNPAFTVAEFLWVASGQDEPEPLCFFNENMRRFADWHRGTTWPWPRPAADLSENEARDEGRLRFFGAYGPPVRAQLSYVLAKLREPDTRQAVLTIWRPAPPATADVPCTLALHFTFRRGALELTTYMRSNDAWLGFANDVPLFTRLQWYAAQRLGVPVGAYHHVATSMHLYETNLEAARGLVAAGPASAGEPYPELAHADDLDLDEVWRQVKRVAGGYALEPEYARLGGWGDLLLELEGFAQRKRERLKAEPLA